MPLSAIRAKVEEDLRQSQALAVIWKRPITAAALQRETERMARDTQQPERLRALFAALGHDPYVIAECLARPALSRRLIRAWYAGDEHFHGTLRQAVEAEVQAHGTLAAIQRMSGEYAEAVWVETAEGRREAEEGQAPALRLTAKEWRERRGRLAGLFGGEIRRNAVSPVEETAEGYAVTAVREETAERMKVATVTWRKRPFAEWWAETAPDLAMAEAAGGAGYRLPALRASGAECLDDTWQRTLAPPDPRTQHTAVWTGTEMIVWGGTFPITNTGGRYDPATDTWLATSLIGAASARGQHAGVWTGTEMIAWGGTFPVTNSGGRYCARAPNP